MKTEIDTENSKSVLMSLQWDEDRDRHWELQVCTDELTMGWNRDQDGEWVENLFSTMNCTDELTMGWQPRQTLRTPAVLMSLQWDDDRDRHWELQLYWWAYNGMTTETDTENSSCTDELTMGWRPRQTLRTPAVLMSLQWDDDRDRHWELQLYWWAYNGMTTEIDTENSKSVLMSLQWDDDRDRHWELQVCTDELTMGWRPR